MGVNEVGIGYRGSGIGYRETGISNQGSVIGNQGSVIGDRGSGCYLIVRALACSAQFWLFGRVGWVLLFQAVAGM